MSVEYLLLCVGELASTPGPVFALTSELVKIRHRIDCMLENVQPSLTNKTLEAPF